MVDVDKSKENDKEKERKTPEKIKEKILEALNKKPLNALEISKEISSNWSTVKNYVEELLGEKKIKYVIFGSSIIYQKLSEDTYFNLPLTKEEKETFYFLFDNTRKKFRELGKEPTKTDINKSIIKIIDKFKIEVPTVWYLYGKMALLKYEPEKDYSNYSAPEKSKEILVYLNKSVEEIAKKRNSREVREEQYLRYGKDLYQRKEEIYSFILNKDLDKNKEKLKELLSSFLLCLPTTHEFNSTNELVADFVIILRKISHLEKLNSNKKLILESFDNLWKLLAIHSFFDSLVKYSRFKNKEEIMSLYFENSMIHKYSILKDSISDLSSAYIGVLKELKEPPKLPKTPITDAMKEIINEMAIEGVEDGEFS